MNTSISASAAATKLSSNQSANSTNNSTNQPCQEVIIFDTTLRDGEQSAGATMLLEEKLAVAAVLDSMKVDIIEAGFPIASEGDFASVSAVAKAVKNAKVCALARAEVADIEAAGRAIKHAQHPRIHTFISTSALHMKHKLQMEPEAVYERVISSVKLARNLCAEVEWSPEDGTRSDFDFLCRCIEAAITHGASTINIPDTVGYAIPQQFAEMISSLISNVPNSDKAIFSVHCHNDLGMAVANSLAGLQAGARQVECTVNGLGERAGNASLEELVMAIKTRRDAFGFTTKVDSTKLVPVSKLVASVTGFMVQNNKAIVGRNAFAHESGIHQDGMLKNAETYEIMRPESVGWSETSLVMGKHSGRAALRAKLSELGFDLEDEALRSVFLKFKQLADIKKHVYDDDLIALIEGTMHDADAYPKLTELSVMAGTGKPQRAVVVLDFDGDHRRSEATGNGPVDAIFKAIGELLPHSAHLQLYQVEAVTGDTDAQADVSVRLAQDSTVVTGRGTDVDTMVASAQAYVSAICRLHRTKHGWQKPAEVFTENTPSLAVK